LITRDVWGFLAGDVDNDAFNRALNEAIFARKVVGKEAPVLYLHCHPQDWNGQLEVVFKPRPPIGFARRRYIGRALTYDWRANVPEGFTVQIADASLLERPGLELPDDVRKVLEMCGPDEDPAQKGFGFVAWRNGKIAAHVVVDCIVGSAGDVGLVTAEEYRRRGLATVTAAAAMEYGLSHGLTLINWDCAESNLGSLRTAEKLGFQRERDHKLYLLDFDETWHMLGLARNELEEKHYTAALEVCQGLLQQEDVPPYAHHIAACACAALGQRDEALEYLNTAVDKGWTFIHHTESRQEFDLLRGAPEWDAALQGIRQNIEKRAAG
jgi:RimJ/RimL family protein N-acetyltransferase